MTSWTLARPDMSDGYLGCIDTEYHGRAVSAAVWIEGVYMRAEEVTLADECSIWTHDSDAGLTSDDWSIAEGVILQHGAESLTVPAASTDLCHERCRTVPLRLPAGWPKAWLTVSASGAHVVVAGVLDACTLWPLTSLAEAIRAGIKNKRLRAE